MTPRDPQEQPPPSFAPSSGRRRPSDEGAAIVSGPAGRVETTRVMPVTGPEGSAPSEPARPPVRHPRPATQPRRGAASQPPPVRPSDAGGYDGPGGFGPDEPSTDGRPPRRKRRKGRTFAIVAVVLVLLLLAWPVGLAIWANGQINHVDALSNRDSGPATTYLLTGSDSRAETDPDSTIKGGRTDTLLLLTVPKNGTTSLISIPRDTFVEIPGYGPGKINAAYAYGGAKLLVETIEDLIDTKVDAYVEIGFQGVRDVVDAVGGVELCLDYDVDDRRSKLKWKAGCHKVQGKKALAFTRMRYSDPKGDIGRAERQRQVITAISKEVKDPGLLFNPGRQVSLISAGTSAVVTDEDANIFTLGRLALAFRKASGDEGVRGTPPIKSLDYRPGGVGSTVLLDPDEAPGFFKDVREGNLEPGEVGGID